MELTEEDKKYILNEHLRNISHIANKDYQVRIWICAEGPEVDDFDETVCHFFDDGDPILKKYKEFGITEEQYRDLKSFRDQFEEFADNHDFPHEFMDTPEWNAITKKAQQVLQKFGYKKSQ